ncbi:MAG: TetR/AcrR family transcriptional regulator [Polyangiales bacterium]
MPTSRPKRSYHHGDLRRALVDAAWQLVRDGGLQALSLREVARVVGVSHAAPYHHFPTRGALLDALAEQAFTGLEHAQRVALGDLTDGPQMLYAIGRAYIDFAREHPEQVLVMFRARAEDEGASPASLIEIGERAFAQLFDVVSTCQQQGAAPQGDTHELALAQWSLVHGFAKLWVEGPLTVMPSYANSFERLRDALLHGVREGWSAQARQTGAGVRSEN